jgi:hypothetical protein
MYCRRCGTRNDDKALTCVACGEQVQDLPSRKIDNHLALAIIVTVLCCLPFGIVGIVYAAQVNSKIQGGDIPGAEQSAHMARTWSLWGLGLGLIGYLGYIVLAMSRVWTER